MGKKSKGNVTGIREYFIDVFKVKEWLFFIEGRFSYLESGGLIKIENIFFYFNIDDRIYY